MKKITSFFISVLMLALPLKSETKNENNTNIKNAASLNKHNPIFFPFFVLFLILFIPDKIFIQVFFNTAITV